MNRNVEIKAKVEDPEALRRRVAAVADEGPVELEQVDTFFRCVEGRLKLRELTATRGELIFYRRSDSAGPTESSYMIAATHCPRDLQQVLTTAHGVSGVVRKLRVLYRVDQTRIHLDHVEGLGNYVELEVVLGEGQSEAEGSRIATGLMSELEIPTASLEPLAYVDLLDREEE
jgi:adenylate cyclase